MIKDVELTLYNENNDAVAIPLTPMQVKTISKILFMELTETGVIAASDETLAKLWNMKGNPLKLKQKTTT